MGDKKEMIPITIDPRVAAVGFLRRFPEATQRDADTLVDLFGWMIQQGKRLGEKDEVG